ncbi:MAG: phosphomannomutase/phosphoglucomutase [Clostridia bacterium]|nr:phosphomannomutase/phosphoglucomutase [Clostridia bacterium]
MSLMKLKSGTDIRGTAIGKNTDLTDNAVKKIISGFVRVMCEKTGKTPSGLKVSIGHDSRLSAERIRKNVVSVLSYHGVKIIDCSLASTPAMFMTTVTIGCDAAIQITASHHPSDKNGLKFFTENGGFENEDIIKTLEYAQDADISAIGDSDNSEKLDFMSQYAEMHRKMICEGINAENYDRPLEGFHIVTDAGNGVGGFYATQVLEKLGADISGSLYLDPDGNFPNHAPNPENAEAMKSISDAVINSGADFGVIFDTDVDRSACVDSEGNEINRNALIALASAIALENNPGGTIVTDSVTSDGLKYFIENVLGGKHHRFRRGYKNVINESLRLNSIGINSPLAIETSGHAALRENYFLDDGAYLITKIIILLVNLKKEGKTPADLISELPVPAEEKELRFPILDEDFRTSGQNVIKDFEEYAKNREGWYIAEDNHEGLRVSLDENHGNGWMLLRQSVHDPILPFNAESNSEGGVKKIIREFSGFIKNQKSVDTSVMEGLDE